MRPVLFLYCPETDGRCTHDLEYAAVSLYLLRRCMGASTNNAAFPPRRLWLVGAGCAMVRRAKEGNHGFADCLSVAR